MLIRYFCSVYFAFIIEFCYCIKIPDVSDAYRPASVHASEFSRFASELNTKELNKFGGDYDMIIQRNVLSLLGVEYHPRQLITMKYKYSENFNGTTYQKVLKPKVGTTVPARLLTKEPLLLYYADDDTYYTLLMIDRDPMGRKESKKIGTQWLNWLVVNIPGYKVENGEVKVEYVGPCPSKGTGPHRFILLLYEQNYGLLDLRNFTFISKDNFIDRDNFKIREFLELYNLDEPDGSNFFYVEWNPNVEEIYSKYTNPLNANK